MKTNIKTPQEKALYTAKWAKIMAKWLITYSNHGRKWQLVSFEGPKGNESSGVIDIMAIRKDYKYNTDQTKKGDLFEIILIQVKGGSAKMPTTSDCKRMEAVKKYHKAKTVLLIEWKIKKSKMVYELKKGKWEMVGDLNKYFM